MKTYTEALRTGLTTKEASTFINKEMFYETLKLYKAKGFKVNAITSHQILLDDWWFTWDEGFAIMNTTLRGTS